ncbi:MAG: hypothetical protein M1283_03665 [Gammaproteobacteria bacterium]|nr:hypothetical protein [Gammaproteobacteria bacterium]
MNRAFIPVTLLVTLLSACGSMPMTPAEYRQAAKSGSRLSMVETFEVNRPFAEVAGTLQKKSPECLSFRLGSTRKPMIGGSTTTHYYARTKQTVLVSAKRAELHFQVRYNNVVNKEPQDGRYVLVADAYPVGNGKTRVDIYRRTKAGLLAQAIRGWASGENLGCPDQTKIL